MSVSLYYTAKRDHALSKPEQESYQKVVERYIEDDDTDVTTNFDYPNR